MKQFFNDSIDKLADKFSGAAPAIFSILDILIIAGLLYLLFLFLHKHNCTRLIKFIIIAVVIAEIAASETAYLTLTSKLASLGIIIVIITLVLLFPQEIRRTLFKLSSSKNSSEVFTTDYDCSDDELKTTIDEIVRAVQNMAKKDVGALIVIAPQQIPYNILESGTKMDALLTCPLLESIFNTKAPLHDGAVFVRGNRIVAAGCFVSLTQKTTIDKEMGTRHRAAIGVTETNNVMAIIVSEETGIISVAEDGEIARYFDSVMLHEKLEQVYGLRAVDANKQRRTRKKRK